MQLESILDDLDKHFQDVKYIKEIKSGKEASVHLIEADKHEYALKIYKENQKYSTKTTYMMNAEIGDHRTARAIRNKTEKGKDSLVALWTAREFKVMRMLSQISSNIPQVYLYGKDYILMDFIGDQGIPAPRLDEITFSRAEAEQCFEEVIESVTLFVENGFVHGDLSEYNILWYRGHAVVIDFPQVLDLGKNPACYEKFCKDLDNIEKYFKRYSFDISSKILSLYGLFHQKRIYG